MGGVVGRLGIGMRARTRLLLAGLLAGMLALAWARRFVQDDAFIVFRYADHLARGLGLVYNPGERVEGYTCFLYTVLMALGLKLGAEPVALSYAVGLAAAAVTMLATFRLARGLWGSDGAGLLAAGLLGSNASFQAYATGGLETSLQTALLTAFLALAAESLRAGAGPARRAALSLIAALALLDRLDAALVLLPIYVLLIRDAWGRGEGRGGPLAWYALPGAVPIAAWLVWKWSYYGALLPNTFHAKIGPAPEFESGLFYLYRFVTSYGLLAPLAVAAVLAPRWLRAGGAFAVAIAASLGLWLLFLASTGGDFMEFRQLVPVLPLLFVILARALIECGPRIGAALAVVVVLGSVHHALTFSHVRPNGGIESVWHLRSHLETEEQNWVGIGKVLGRELGADTSVAIAVTCAGAIPYYSGLRTVDQLGLNDAWVAREGARDGIVGHQRAAPLDYLMSRRVNLVIGHPVMIWRETIGPVFVEDFPVPRYRAGAGTPQLLPPGLKVVEIPIDRGYRLMATYLTPNPTVDRAIQAYGWKVRALTWRPETAGTSR